MRRDLVSLAFGLIVATSAGCAKRSECAEMRRFIDQEVNWLGAPQQSDMSRKAQAANWRWRADRATERATGARALKISVTELKARQQELASHYDGLAKEADLVAKAFDAGDSAAMNSHSAAFDNARGEPADALHARIEKSCR